MQQSFNKLFFLLFLIGSTITYGQKHRDFSSKEEYLKFLSKEYGIDPNEVYYASTEGTKYFEKVSSILFIKDNKIATNEEVYNILETSCPIQRVYNQVDQNTLDRVLTASQNLPYILLKKLNDGTTFTFDGSKYVVFHFSYKLGKSGKKFISARKTIQGRLGYKPIILITDGADIPGVPDIDKTVVEMH